MQNAQWYHEKAIKFTWDWEKDGREEMKKREPKNQEDQGDKETACSEERTIPHGEFMRTLSGLTVSVISNISPLYYVPLLLYFYVERIRLEKLKKDSSF